MPPPRPEAGEWQVAPGEHARLTPEGPAHAVIESRGELPLRVRTTAGMGSRARPHPGTAVVLGKETFEVAGAEERGGVFVYLLEHWPREQVIRDRVQYGPRLVRSAQAERRQARVEAMARPLTLLCEMLAALLPEPERRPLADRLSLDVVRGTLLVAAIQVLGAGILWPVGFVTWYRGELDAVHGQILREQRDVTRKEIGESGLFGTMAPVLYLVTPQSLGLLYVLFTGLARYLHLKAGGGPLGDPVLALVLGARRAWRVRTRERERLETLGPERPDRVVEEGEDLLVISARAKPEWTPIATVQIGERLYRVREAADRDDGEWTAIGYRLTPVEAGRMVRGLVRYALPGAQRRARAAPVESAPEQPETTPVAAPRLARRSEAAVEVPAEDVRGRTRAGDETRTNWRIDEGEEARLTPEGESAAVIESLGSLPLRARSQTMGAHHRPEFAGTCVLVGGRRFEVVEEEPREVGFRYLLEPWPRNSISRQTIEYGPALVRAAQRERQAAEELQRRRHYTPLFYPFVGLLPEEQQVAACARHGLDPTLATLAGIGAELTAAAWILHAMPGNLAVVVIVFPALMRLLGLAFGEIGGSPYVAFAVERTGGRKRSDATVIPLTRSAFWARLPLPDKQENLPDGSVIVKGLLPHLSWGGAAAAAAPGRPTTVVVEDDLWNVSALPPSLEKGRLTYVYHLWAVRDPSMRPDLPDPRPPDPRHYQWDVLDQVSREWDDVFFAAPWLPTLLPRDAQERAYHGRGAVEGARRWTVITGLATVVAGLWVVTGRGPFNLLLGLLLIGEGGSRVWRALSGEFAPSLLGLPFADMLRPERLAYHAHRDAERSALVALKSR